MENKEFKILEEFIIQANININKKRWLNTTNKKEYSFPEFANQNISVEGYDERSKCEDFEFEIKNVSSSNYFNSHKLPCSRVWNKNVETISIRRVLVVPIYPVSNWLPPQEKILTERNVNTVRHEHHLKSNDFIIQTDRKVKANFPDIVIKDHKKTEYAFL